MILHNHQMQDHLLAHHNDVSGHLGYVAPQTTNINNSMNFNVTNNNTTNTINNSNSQQPAPADTPIIIPQPPVQQPPQLTTTTTTVPSQQLTQTTTIPTVPGIPAGLIPVYTIGADGVPVLVYMPQEQFQKAQPQVQQQQQQVNQQQKEETIITPPVVKQ
eukprot:UN06999